MAGEPVGSPGTGGGDVGYLDLTRACFFRTWIICAHEKVYCVYRDWVQWPISPLSLMAYKGKKKIKC